MEMVEENTAKINVKLVTNGDVQKDICSLE